jgi:hypothetical protein
MFKTLLLKNFKSFEGVHQIPLAPLTLIFGKNSAGKSSIIQSLLFLKQSEKALWNGEPAIWKGDDVDLGSMEHALFGQGRRPGYDEISVGLVGAGRRGTEETFVAGEPPEDDQVRLQPSVLTFFRRTDPRFDPVRFTWGKTTTRGNSRVDVAHRCRWELLDAQTYEPKMWSVIGQATPDRTAGPFVVQVPSDNCIFSNTHAHLNPEYSGYREKYDNINNFITNKYIALLGTWSQFIQESIKNTNDMAFYFNNEHKDTYDARDFRWLVEMWEREHLRGLMLVSLRSEDQNGIFKLQFKDKHDDKDAGIPLEDFITIFDRLESIDEEDIYDNGRKLWRGRVGQIFIMHVMESIQKLNLTQNKDLLAILWNAYKNEIIALSRTNCIEIEGALQEKSEPDPGLILRIFESIKSLRNSSAFLLYDELKHLGQWVSDDFSRAIVDEEQQRITSLQNIYDVLQEDIERYRTRGVTFRDFLADGAVRWSSRAALEAETRTRGNGHAYVDSGWTFTRQVYEHIYDIDEYFALNVIGYSPGYLINDIWKIGDVVHIKGVRNQLQRAYEGLRDGQATTGDGARTSAALVNRLSSTPEVRDVLNDNLKKLGLPYEFEVSTVSNPVFPISYQSFVIRDSRNGVAVGAQDVGYGVGQVIPVLVAMSDLKNEVLLLEQPELHLHPAMQATLGEMLVDAVLASSGQIIAETHSEHVILRVLRLIREKKISHEMVQVLYIDQDEEGKSRHINLPIDEYGEFTEDWPNGFFDERLREL